MNLRFAPLLFLAATAVALAAMQGCATLSEADCVSADWAVMGESDGQQGRPISELNRYRSQCSAFGVEPDSEAYLQGRELGLTVFCTHNNGYREGRSGAQGEPVCPAALEPPFRSGFDLGRAVFVSLSQLQASSNSIASARNRIGELESEIAHREALLRSDDLDVDEERRLREEIDTRTRRIDDLEENLLIQVGVAGAAVARYRAAVVAARAQGHFEPMEDELIRQLQRLTL